MSYRLLSPKAEEEKGLDQWNSRTPDGEIESFKNRTITDLFKRYLDGKKCRILEGGCGLGAWCEWFRRRGHDAVGVEYYNDIVKIAKRLKPDIPVFKGDVAKLDYPDNAFDVYVSLGVIEHFENGPQAALREARRVLKDKGLAFIATPYLSPMRRLITHPIRSLYFIFRKLLGRQSYFWEYRFTARELQKYIEEVGFKVIYVGIDDYIVSERERHIGLWADWFFLRKHNGKIWELNRGGKLILRILNLFPRWWYCSGIIIVGQSEKGT